MQKSIDSRTNGMPLALFCVRMPMMFAQMRWAMAIASFVFCALISLDATAQEDLFLVFGSVKLEDANKRLQGVDVIVYQDGEVFDQLITNAKGDYDFELPLRHRYTFSFVLDGHSNKRIEVDASGIPESVTGNRNMDLDMSMMPLPSGFDASIFEDAYGRGQYDANKNTVVFDNNYTVRMRNKVNAEFARLERLDGEAERMKENFDDFVRKGNRAKSEQEWQNAIDYYESALAVFPNEQEVMAKRDQAQAALEAANASNASAAAFQELLDSGNASLSKDALAEARQAFNAAQDMQPNAREPRDGLERVKAREVELANSSEIDAEYAELIEDADKYFEREQYNRAIDLYNEAIVLKPSERYPQNQIDEAEARKSSLASQASDIVERTIQYESLIDEANQLFRDDNYELALAKYESAGEVLPAERFWQQRAAASKERWEEQLEDNASRAAREQAAAERSAASAELKEKRGQYDAINDDADVFFRNDDYEAAIVKYEEALAVLPEERYPQQRITEARKRINEAAGIDESEEDTADATKSDADAESKEDKRNEDREAKRSASLEASDTERESRQAAEDEARTAAQAAESAYNDFIQTADDAFDASNWAESRSKYNDALVVKPNDRYAQSRLSRILKAESGNSDSVQNQDLQEEDFAALEAERFREQQELQALEDSEQQVADSDRQKRLDDAADEESERIARQQAAAEVSRRRAEKMATQLNSKEEDEVEAYFSEALKSEAQGRKAQVERAKQAQIDLLKQASAKASERSDFERIKMQGRQQEAQADIDSSLRIQEKRRNEQADQREVYNEKAIAAERRSERLIRNGQDAVNSQLEARSNLTSNHARDYASNVPEIESKKRSWRNLFRGMNRAASEKRTISFEDAAATSRTYRAIGKDSDKRAQQRWFAIKRKAQRGNQALSKRERESQQRSYDKRKVEEQRLKNMSPKLPEDYNLSREDTNVLRGVNEESYDIPNGLVIERTVRIGNKVVRYRKVVTKTGTYYFKGDHSITSVTWQRETSVVLD
tara:strand:+ start:1967 stop:5026 length:3060 start_codon:yes stop_codon:yes gene_type:complete